LLEQENAQLRALVVRTKPNWRAMRLATADTFEALLDAPPAAIKTLLGVYVDKVKETVDGFKTRLEAATHAIRQLNDERDQLRADLAERENALKEIYEAKVNDLTWGDGDWARSRAANALGLEDRWSKK
jgi:septal ring factor EnvC (AmiA/AmiB activator)